MIRLSLAAVVGGVLVAATSTVQADFILTPFGANGQGGSINGQTLTFGSAGSVFEIDSFLNVSGLDLNGSTIGTSAQLSLNALPPGLAFTFTYSLSPDKTDLTLRYQFTNASGSTFNDVQFFTFVDSEIDVAKNTYFNEAASVIGLLGSGAGDGHPDSFEIDVSNAPKFCPQVVHK